jgi:hypothetical protein
MNAEYADCYQVDISEQHVHGYQSAYEALRS